MTNNNAIFCKNYNKFLLTEAIKNGNIFKETCHSNETKIGHIYIYYKLKRPKTTTFSISVQW